MIRVAQNRGWLFTLVCTGVLGCCLCVGLAVFLLAPSRSTPFAEVQTVPPNPTSVSNASTHTPAPPTIIAALTNTFAAVLGGLGLTEAEWESSHIRTVDDVVGAVYDSRFIVMFTDGRVAYIEEQWSDVDAIPEADVDANMRPLLPSDAVLLETYSREGRPETFVQVFSSATLAGAFTQDQWGAADPGTFTVQYNRRDGRVTRLILALGNNP